jgi:cell wall-associated NlpC family hydrolase
MLSATWQALPEALQPSQERFRAALERWRGTPYASGQRAPGAGADCMGFVLGVVDDVDGRSRAHDPRIPPDTALHDPKRSARAVRDILAVYAPWERVENGLLQPLDILIVGPAGAGPSHGMIVGPTRNTIWHCTPTAGVHQAGWCLGTGYDRLHHVYRLADRERWAA